MNVIDVAVQTIKKHTPEILMGVGIVGIGVGTVMACKEARKMDPILNEHKDQMEQIHMAADMEVVVDEETGQSAPYTEKDKRRDTFLAYGKTAIKMAELFAPSVGVISLSLGCVVSSHVILRRHNLALTAAYGGISTTFNNYRKNIREKFGEAADAEAMYSIKAKKVKGKDGEEETIEYSKTPDTEENDHSRFFDAESRCWDKNVNLNLMTLHSAEAGLNRKLKARRSHTVTLNEIYDVLWRQNPALDIGNIVEVEDNFGVNGNVVLTKQEYSYAGYLGGHTEGRGINVANT